MNLIYIPSSGRANVQATLQALGPALWPRVRLVVQPGQLNAYRAANWPCTLLTLPGPLRIGPTRAWIARHAMLYSINAFYVLDDDIRFLVRGPDMKLQRADEHDVARMFTMLDRWLDDRSSAIGIVSISARFGNNFVDKPYKLGSRVSQFLSYRTSVAKMVQWGRVQVYTEHDITLQVLKLGYTTKVAYNFAYQETGGYQAPGGCSVWRTPEIEDATARKMVKLHAPHSKLKIIKDKRWGGREMARATFRWKDIYLSGLPEELQ